MSHSLSIDVDAQSSAAAAAKASSASTSKTASVQATSSARIKLNTKSLYVSAVRGEQGRGQRFRVTNVGTKSLKLDSKSFSFSGADASYFKVVSGTLPRTLKVNAGASFTIALVPTANAPTDRVLAAKLNVKAAGSSTILGKIDVRGIATVGEGGNNEPSLARLVELFNLSIDVGDSTPNTTSLDIPNGADTDEIDVQRFRKASASAPVEIELLSVYLSPSDTYAGRFGYYTPGSPDTRKTLFSVYGIDAQNVKPTPNGASRFDPGSAPFSLWGDAPVFVDDDGNVRVTYGEDALNTWEPNASERGKVRVYPYKEGGKTVANAYVVTFEDYELDNDQNDYVAILRNVTAAPANKAEIGLIPLDGQPNSTRLAMNRIQNQTAQYNSDFFDTARVRVVNTGDDDLNISSISINGADAAAFQVVGGGNAGTLAPGATRDVSVRFIASSAIAGGIHKANLVINSNDDDEATTNIALTGLWQSYAEADLSANNTEPDLQTILDALGYRVDVVKDGEILDNKGKTEAVGDEVLSAYWRAADANIPVQVQEIAGFHQTDTASYVAWYERGRPWYYITDPRYNASTNGDENRLFRMEDDDTQQLFPNLEGSTTAFARGEFKTDKAFGFRIDGELSDDSLNIQQPGDLGGHHVRFYPVRDAGGNTVPNTYLMVLDFSSINFDYQDHVLLISNIRPADRNAAVDAIGAYGTSGGIMLDWNDVPEARSYDVYRAEKSAGTYTRVADNILVSQFLDTKAKANKTWYYRVVANNSNGNESVPMNISAKRTS